MKTIKLTTNIGAADLRQLGLAATDKTPFLEGDTVQVPPAAADRMVRRGWAAEPTAAPARAPEVPKK